MGVFALIYFGHKSMETNFINEKIRASRFVAEPIRTAIYEDMIEERADLVRHMLDDATMAQGRDSIFIVRNNGVEAAFRDMKTINEVIKVYGKVRPEWLVNHANEPHNVAAGIHAPEFKEAFERFRKDWSAEPTHYIEKGEGGNFFVYLQPIEPGFKCKTCHAGDGARGVLVIRMPLDQMYASLIKSLFLWTFAGIAGVAGGCTLLFIIIKRNVTDPLHRNAEMIKTIARDNGSFTKRFDVDAAWCEEIDEVGTALNKLFTNAEKREEESKRLLEAAQRDSGNLQAMLDALPEMVSIHDVDKRALKVNKALATSLNTTPQALIGKRCHEIFYNHKVSHKDCPHTKAVSARENVVNEYSDMLVSGMCKVQSIPIINAYGETTAVVHVLRDVIVEKVLSEQHIYEEKHAYMDKLVAGLAPEVNKPPISVIGFGQLSPD